jgi:hypothetical protein
MDRVGERWWPVLGAVYMLVAVKRVRGMRLVGLARRRDRAQGPGRRRGGHAAGPEVPPRNAGSTCPSRR